ncbi:Cytidine monophosphate-N-acetylneuraminic acid hydroxylase [Apodemus speciosus]|uniref:Cytidine monophosphate-N-acetylneuraminic acid hydroxylase n=1 Tax=Apodemus speciosus TaxID=105296 RepID=A0ABQ0FFK0_APOSI
MKQTAETLLSLSPAEVANLKEGINFFRNKTTGKDYILYKEKDHLKACKNLCKHQGGLFMKDIEDLDGRVYELVVEMDENNGLSLVELNPPNPWDSDPRSPEELAFGEVQITYLTHACMDLKLGDKRMAFDPWLTGPAFARGWWLLHEPPSDWLERLCRADLIYISHMHSDHLRSEEGAIMESRVLITSHRLLLSVHEQAQDYPTLKQLSQRRPDIPIYVGDTERPVFWYLDQSGVQLTNINVVPFGMWQQVDQNLRFMILMDGVHPEMDTCIIVEYKGHKILNTVDCTRPNGGRLPEKVALMMSDFAGGASGFPMTFSGGKFTEEWKAQFIKAERRKLLNYKAQLVKDLQPRIYCPFAGYFVESHPSDNKGIVEPPEGTKIYKDSWDFGPYLKILNSAIRDEIFLHSAWIKEYFTWAGFKNYNLVVRMIETDEDFNPSPGGYDYLVDFLDLSFPKERPSREHPYEEIRSRVDVIRHVVKNGLLWDDLYIGFQTRLQRDPDIYHHLVLESFSDKTPSNTTQLEVVPNALWLDWAWRVPGDPSP